MFYCDVLIKDINGDPQIFSMRNRCNLFVHTNILMLGCHLLLVLNYMN